MFFHKKGVVPSSKDFTKDDLPVDRKEQFFRILKEEWKLLLLLCFFLLLLFVPYLGVTIYGQYYLSVHEDVDQFAYSMMFETIKAVSLILPFSAFGGLSKVYRRLYLGEGVLFWKDFFEGWHVLFALFGLLYGSTGMLLVYLSSLSGSFSFAGVFYFLVLGAFCLLAYPWFCFSLAQLPIYSYSRVKGYFSNGSKFALKHFPWMFLFALLPLAHYLLGFIPLPLVAYNVILCLLAFLSPIYELVFSGFAISKFDLYLNKENYPSLYKKGIKEDKKLEDEAKEEDETKDTIEKEQKL